MDYKFLMVEDSTKIRRVTCDFFTDKSAGEIVMDEAATGTDALSLINSNSYDLVFLDVMLPGVSGFELCREIRKKSMCPIIFLTALGAEDNVLKGYEMGGDDYVTKPFSLKELYAKSTTMVKRYKRVNEPKLMELGSIKLNPLSMQVFVDSVEVYPSPKEYFILKLFMENPQRVFTRDQILNHVWGYDFDGNDRVVDSQIKKLRKNLGSSGKQIVTIVGGGYKITEGRK